MKKLSHLGMLLIVLVLFAVSATLVYEGDETLELWVKRYNGPGNGSDVVSAIAVDSEGNVFVTGHSVGIGTSQDYATVAYDSSGDELWVKRYNGPGNGNDSVQAITVDSRANVYVTGESTGIGSHQDYATVAYDSSGEQLWFQRHNGPRNYNDRAHAIAVDSGGNVYVTGSSYGNWSYEDYGTVAYDSFGNERWLQRYNGPGDHWDVARAIAVDSGGNIYVTGWSMGSGTSSDYATVKYDTNGNELWVKRYNGPGNLDDQAFAIAVDSEGNVFVTGLDRGSGTYYDYATVKYDTNGNELWVKRYNGPGNWGDRARAIAVDSSSGNVYVTGSSYGIGTSYDYATVAYDRLGYELWVRRYDGPENSTDNAHAIAVDSGGNVYVTGQSYGSGTNYDYATVAYDSSGNELLVKRYNGPGNFIDNAHAIAVDTEGNVYVTGRSFGSGTHNDYTTVKYDLRINKLIEKVDTLVDEGVLNQGEANALNTKLDNALQNLDKGNIQAAYNELEAFINQVNAFINSRRLTPEQGQALIEVIQSVMDGLYG